MFDRKERAGVSPSPEGTYPYSYNPAMISITSIKDKIFSRVWIANINHVVLT